LVDLTTANIRNKNTRRAYYKVACRFSDWCESRGLDDLARVKPAGAEEDLPAIIEEYLLAHGDFEFDEIEIVNKRPMNIGLHAKCRKFIDPDEPEEEQVSKAEAEEEISGKYEDNNEPA